MSTEETVRVVIAADKFEANHFLATQMVMNALTRMGVPVIGPVGVISVESGRLTMECAGRAFVYKWAGVPLPQHLRSKQFTLEKTMAQAIEQENEL
jgi:hypothetical protein